MTVIELLNGHCMLAGAMGNWLTAAARQLPMPVGCRSSAGVGSPNGLQVPVAPSELRHIPVEADSRTKAC